VKPGSEQAAKAAEKSLTREADAYWESTEYVCADCGDESANNEDWYQDAGDDWHCVACTIAEARGIFL
jgi:DNA-directed RNA polymerase subunit RPC12/RpoP